MPKHAVFPAGSHSIARRAVIEGNFTTGTAGAVSSQYPATAHESVTVTKDQEGRYKFAFQDAYTRIITWYVSAPRRVAEIQAEDIDNSAGNGASITVSLYDLDGTPSELDIDSTTAYFQFVLQRDA